MIDKIIIVLFSNGIINELYILLAETKKQNLYLLELHRKLAVKKLVNRQIQIQGRFNF